MLTQLQSVTVNTEEIIPAKCLGIRIPRNPVKMQKLLREKITSPPHRRKYHLWNALAKVKSESDLGSTNNLQEIHKTKEQENFTNGVKSANPEWKLCKTNNQIF